MLVRGATRRSIPASGAAPTSHLASALWGLPGRVLVLVNVVWVCSGDYRPRSSNRARGVYVGPRGLMLLCISVSVSTDHAALGSSGGQPAGGPPVARSRRRASVFFFKKTGST